MICAIMSSIKQVKLHRKKKEIYLGSGSLGDHGKKEEEQLKLGITQPQN